MDAGDTGTTASALVIDHENDLPLSANIDCISIHHFILDLTCNLHDKIFTGCIIILCKPIKNEKESCETIVFSKERLFCEKGGTGNLQSLASNLSDTEKNDGKRVSSLSLQMEISKSSRGQVYETNDLLKGHISTEKTPTIYETDCLDEKTSSYSNTNKAQSSVNNSTCNEFQTSENKSNTTSHETKSFEQKSTEHSSCAGSSFQEKESKDFVLILDSSDIDVSSVEEIEMNSSHELLSLMKGHHHGPSAYFEDLNTASEQLQFTVDRHCTRISKKGVKTPENFPRIVRINYCTRPEGKSLKWTFDQDGSLCVFTHGHWLNNRSLFPSQDAPVSMATWEAVIHVESELTVLMSGDDLPLVTIEESSDRRAFYYHTNMLMPTSTLALAVGTWGQTDVSDRESSQGILPCRLFVPTALEPLALAEIRPYLPRCLAAAAKLLGAHPFTRLDVVIVPPCFDSLGMASPSLIFLSQSVLTGDSSLCIRLSHEVSHSWFGLAIGPKEWTEEWLTEGFCTYTEGHIHAKAMGWDDKTCREHADLRDVLRHRTLASELENTEEELQVLRPNNAEETLIQDDVKYIKNGMNPDKKLMQVHYLKGYFLLRYLEKAVGVIKFQGFLREYVKKFNGQLVTSQDVFSCFLSMFPELRDEGLSETSLSTDWLDQPGVPKDIEDFKEIEDNDLASQVYEQLDYCRSLSKYFKKRKSRKKMKLEINGLQKLEPDQLLVVLDLLLDEKEGRVSTELLTSLRCQYHLLSCNAEIQHRWCELVVKHKVSQCYKDIEHFLINHQALGVYLYGEMIISGSKKQKEIAEACFHVIEKDMEEGLHKIVHAMLYGN